MWDSLQQKQHCCSGQPLVWKEGSRGASSEAAGGRRSSAMATGTWRPFVTAQTMKAHLETWGELQIYRDVAELCTDLAMIVTGFFFLPSLGHLLLTSKEDLHLFITAGLAQHTSLHVTSDPRVLDTSFSTPHNVFWSGTCAVHSRVNVKHCMHADCSY